MAKPTNLLDYYVSLKELLSCSPVCYITSGGETGPRLLGDPIVLTKHSLIASNKQLSTSLLKTNVGDWRLDTPPLETHDPMRSNIFAYWYGDKAYSTGPPDSGSNIRWGLDSTKSSEGSTGLNVQILSKKYSEIGLDIFFAPGVIAHQFLDADGGAKDAPFSTRHKQTLIFQFDYIKFVNLYGEIIDKINFDWHLYDQLGAPIFFYSVLAALMASPEEKFENNPFSPSHWNTPVKSDADDHNYKGFVDYANQIYWSETKDGFDWDMLKLAAFYGHRLHQGIHYDLTFNAPLPLLEEASAWSNWTPDSQESQIKLIEEVDVYSQTEQGGGYINIKPVIPCSKKQYLNCGSYWYDKGITKQAGLKEYVLPNIYAMDPLVPGRSGTLTDILTLGGKIPEKYLSIKTNEEINIQNSDKEQGVAYDNPYFDLFGKLAFDVQITDQDIKKAEELCGHIFISPDQLKFIKDANVNKDSFPAYVDIKFDIASPGDFCEIFANTNELLDLMKSFAATWYTHADEQESGKFVLKTYINEASIDMTNWKERRPFDFCSTWNIPPALTDAQMGTMSTSLGQFANGVKFVKHSAPMLDLNEWWHNRKDNTEIMFNMGPDTLPFVGIASDFIDPLFDKYGVFFTENVEVDALTKVIQALAAYAGIQDRIKKHFRSYEEILNGKKAYSEIVFYRIEKAGFVNGTTGGEVKLQNIWVPNHPGHDVFNYIDTQVKYGNKYKYTVFAYKLVIGNKYRYKFYSSDRIGPQQQKLQEWLSKEPNSLTGVDDYWDIGPSTKASGVSSEFIEGIAMAKKLDPGGTAGSIPVDHAFRMYTSTSPSNNNYYCYIDVLNDPDVQLVEVPLYKTEVAVIDSPPMSPDVVVTPYIGVNNKIKIDLNSQSGDRDLVPIIIEEEDKARFDLIRMAQNADYNFGEAFSPTIRFRFDSHPASFQVYRIEFKPSDYTDFAGSLRTQFSTNNGSSYIDNITPNKKYYYTYRTVDIRGNISNPSYIYEIEMVSEGEVSFLLCEIVDLALEKEKNRTIVETKAMRKYIRIFPADIQLMLNQSLFDGSTKSVTDLNFYGNHNIFGKELEESIFNNKLFKVRLTSKSTGRKIDLNLSFVVEHMPTDKKLLLPES